MATGLATSMAPKNSIKETEVFQHYQVLRRGDGSLWELGVGGMGVTYKAFDTNLRCFVALKVVSAQYLRSEIARQRFIREARAAAQLRHRNIATVYHLGVDPQNFFYSMEFIDGVTLQALVERVGPLPPAVVLRIALQTARALAVASRQGLIHRDIKPANLMVLHEDEEGEDQLVVKVIDFGLARSFAGDGLNTELTVTGFVGTPQYASPEQLEEKDLDVRSDIYSLGITLWFLLTGRPPFAGKLTHLISQHLTAEPPWSLLAGCPEPVRALLERMLRKDPAQRHQSAGELRREIEECLRTVAGDDGSLTSAPLSASARSANFEGAGRRSLRSTAVGGVVAGRYELLRLAGEGSTAKTFQARDLTGTRLVAAKLYHRELFTTPQSYQELTREAAKVRALPHPILLEVIGVERFGDNACLLMEWAEGPTLMDVLRHRGNLPVVEALALLKPAAAAADHAGAHDLGWLGFGLRHILILPPVSPAAGTGSGPEIPLARMPLTGRIKINSLAEICGSDELATWAGGATLASGQMPRTGRPFGGDDSGRESRYLRALAGLFYELVYGRPPRDVYAMLPRLCEASNEIIRRSLATGSGFGNNLEFFEALSEAEGFNPAAFDQSPVLPSPARRASEPLPPVVQASEILAADPFVPGLSTSSSEAWVLAATTLPPAQLLDSGGRGLISTIRWRFPRRFLYATGAGICALCIVGLLMWKDSARPQKARPLPVPIVAKATPVPPHADAIAPPASVEPASPPPAVPAGITGSSPEVEPSFLLNPPGAMPALLSVDRATFLANRQTESASSWPTDGLTLSAAGGESGDRDNPIRAMAASSAIELPSEIKMDNNDGAGNGVGLPVTTPETTGRPARPSQSARHKRAPRPNVLQRLFGIKPKPR